MSHREHAVVQHASPEHASGERDPEPRVGRMLGRREILRATALGLAAIPLAACSGGSNKFPPDGRATKTPNPALSEAGRTSLQLGAEIPAVVSEAISGPEIDMAKYRGQPFLLNFWAEDCAPCVREFPLLKDAIKRRSDLAILGINVLDRKEIAQTFVERNNATWPSIWDPDGSIAAKKFRVTVLPVTFAVARNFTLVDRIFGELDRNRLDSMIEAMFRA